jgi:hypothetical protein
VNIEKGRWYLSEDILPPLDLQVLGMYSGGCWFAGYRLENYKWWDGEYECERPDYWMVPQKPSFAPVEGKC